MARNQKGITLMSFVIVLVVVGFFALVAMKLFPIYSEHHNLKAVMKEFSAQPNASTLTQPQVMTELERRFNIAYVESVKKEHIKITRGFVKVILNDLNNFSFYFFLIFLMLCYNSNPNILCPIRDTDN